MITTWKSKLEEEIALSGNVRETPVALLGVDGAVHAYDMGHSVIVLADGPKVYVMDKSPGSSGNLREYGPLKNADIPNFKRVVQSAMSLSIKLSEIPKKRNMPKGMLVSPDHDGYYLHIPMLRVSKPTLDEIIKILNADGEQQAPDNTTVPNPGHQGEEAGESVEGGEGDGEGGGPEEGLPHDPEACPAVTGGGCEGCGQDTHGYETSSVLDGSAVENTGS